MSRKNSKSYSTPTKTANSSAKAVSTSSASRSMSSAAYSSPSSTENDEEQQQTQTSTSGDDDETSSEINAAQFERILDTFLQHYLSIKDPSKIISSTKSMKYMHNIFTNVKNFINHEHKNFLDKLSDSNLIGVFVNILDYCLIGLGLSIKKNELRNDIKYIHNFLNAFAQLVWCLTNFSAKFRANFHKHNGTKLLLDFLKDAKIVDYFIIFRKSDFNYLDQNYSLMKAIIGSLHNLSKSFSFDGLDATATLISFMHKLKMESTYLMPIYMTLANVLTDNEIETLPDTMEIIGRLVYKIKKCSRSIRAKPTRVRIDLENKRKGLVCVVEDANGVKWDLTELIRGLDRIAVNDKMKSYIYSSCNMKDIIDQIIIHGTMIEKEFAIKLLHQLSFDANVSSVIVKDKELIKTIQDIMDSSLTNKHPDFVHLVEVCRSFIWSIENKTTQMNGGTTGEMVVKRRLSVGPQAINEAAQLANKKDNRKQIMISYNNQSRDLCVKIKKSLESLGYLIWIDIENIHGSSLEAMANAIENSDCILICMTEKYKLSPNCRAEAEYTFNIRKKFIPLIMQANYKPDGWLGMLLGTKIFVDFTKYAYDEAFHRLKKELAQVFNTPKQEMAKMIAPPSQPKEDDHTNEVSISNTDRLVGMSHNFGSTKSNSKEDADEVENNEPDSNNNPTNVCKWNTDQVNKWFGENKFDNKLCAGLNNFDGEMLQELNFIREAASEYFYKSISNNSQVDLFHVIKFSKQLRKLFN